MVRLALFLLMMPLAANATERAPGERIDPAVMVDVTPEGFDQLKLLAEGLIPQDITLPRIAAGDQANEQCINLIFDDICWTPWRYGYDLNGFDVGVELTDLSIVPHTDQLVFDAVVTLNVNDSATPGNLDFLAQAADVNFFGIQFTVIDINEQCDMWLDPTPITAHTTITLTVTPQGAGQPPTVLVDVAPLQIDLDLHGLQIRNCILQDILNFVDAVNGFLGGVFGFDIYDTLTGLITPIINDALQGVLGNLQQQLQAVFNSLNVEQTIDVLGKQLDVSIQASDLNITDDGLRATLAGSIAGSGNPDPCVSKYGITGSKATGGNLPGIGEAPQGVTPHVAAYVDDDFVNEGLFAAWYEGLLCLNVSSAGGLPIDLPIPLDTSLLGLLSGGAYDDLFPTAQPIQIVTAPRRPPVATFGGNNPINIKVRELGLDIYAELDGRYARMAGLGVGADVGADLAFDGTTGNLSVLLDVPTDAFTFQMVFNDMRPDANQAITDGLGGLVGTIVSPLLGSLGSSLSFPLPALSGLGLTDLLASQAGPDGDLLGVFAAIGKVPYEGAAGGCAGCGGASGSSGSCGCASDGGALSPLWLTPLLVVLRRRRPV